MGRQAATDAVGYYRLSDEDDLEGESGSIKNQRKIVRQYAREHGIRIVREFVDDNFSGATTKRPGFQEMLRFLETEKTISIVITKDLSRLGRSIQETSFYAEVYFPDHGIRYLAPDDGFDTDRDNDMAPFLFAVNDFYLRNGSKKVKSAFHIMASRGEFCFRAPYGYKKDPQDNHKLIPNEDTAPVVKQIFSMACSGASSWSIAEELTKQGIDPPLKYRVVNIESASSKNAKMVSDEWNNTTVKRILTNPVYLGHTFLIKTTKKLKETKKRPVPEDKWLKTYNTHEPLVSQEDFELAHRFLGKRRKDYEENDQVRINVLSGLIFCKTCGSAMCSSGTVYKGERERYWYLSCLNAPARSKHRCEDPARIKYDLIIEVVKEDLNALISLSAEEKNSIICQAIREYSNRYSQQDIDKRINEIKKRIDTISAMSVRVYEDLLEEKISQSIVSQMMNKLNKEDEDLKKELKTLVGKKQTTEDIISAYRKFFELTEASTIIEDLTHEVVAKFIERIEIGPKKYPPGTGKVYARSKVPYTQEVNIKYKYIGFQSMGNDNITVK
ncbi:MAG: recombinase family protein [Oscillospiraceae bacterium]|nr:recombinase family protein [Oscillospiraceae bacterium]MBQ6465869.1 recombinase family protein [Oscillospiraceae bacterium]